MRDKQDFDEGEESLIYTWFATFREIVPTSKRDLSAPVLQRLQALRKDKRLEAPAIDHVLSGYLIETINLLLDWLNRGRDDQKP